MWPSTAWDDSNWGEVRAKGWTVMGTLRERQGASANAAARAAKDLRYLLNIAGVMSPLSAPNDYKSAIVKPWRGGPALLAFLFAMPDSDAIRTLDARGEYFDVRTGDTWNLFFPGYYQGVKGSISELRSGARRVGRGYAGDWYFSAREFDALREHVERSSFRCWEYSGDTDLVLINCWLPARGEPTIDWASTISGQITDQAAGTRTLSLAKVIERITRDFETAAEDASYGVGEVRLGHRNPIATLRETL